MSSKSKFMRFCHDNVVLLVGIPLIIGVHLGWSKLQSVPALGAHQREQKDFPLIAAIKAYKTKFGSHKSPEEIDAK